VGDPQEVVVVAAVVVAGDPRGALGSLGERKQTGLLA
jgi:hypothetical protein